MKSKPIETKFLQHGTWIVGVPTLSAGALYVLLPRTTEMGHFSSNPGTMAYCGFIVLSLRRTKCSVVEWHVE